MLPILWSSNAAIKLFLVRQPVNTTAAVGWCMLKTNSSYSHATYPLWSLIIWESSQERKGKVGGMEGRKRKEEMSRWTKVITIAWQHSCSCSRKKSDLHWKSIYWSVIVVDLNPTKKTFNLTPNFQRHQGKWSFRKHFSWSSMTWNLVNVSNQSSLQCKDKTALQQDYVCLHHNGQWKCMPLSESH